MQEETWAEVADEGGEGGTVETDEGEVSKVLPTGGARRLMLWSSAGWRRGAAVKVEREREREREKEGVRT